MICEIYCTFLNILCNSACFNKKLRRKPQFFFTPVYSSTVFVVIVVTGLPCLSGAVLYVAVVEIVRQALQPLRATAAQSKLTKILFSYNEYFICPKCPKMFQKKISFGDFGVVLGLFGLIIVGDGHSFSDF